MMWKEYTNFPFNISPVAHWRFENHNFRNKLNKPHVVNAHGSEQTWFKKAIFSLSRLTYFPGFASWKWIYESFATVGEIRVYRRADFQSGSRVLKKVFWTFSYLYLWHTMWFHAKKLLKTLKFWKSLNSLCKSGSRPQKSPKKAQKTDHSIAIYSNFWIGMVYFGYHLVNPHVQTVQNMYGKGQGGRTWQAFGGGKTGHETFRQTRIYNFRDKCVVFARNLKFSNLTQ